jgi:pantothenate kinase
MKKIYDKDFKYIPSYDTDVKATFARIRRNLQKRLDEYVEKRESEAVLKNKDNVVPLGSKHVK